MDLGAGPCGTLARCSWVPRLVDPSLFVSQRFVTSDRFPIVPAPTPFAWSLEHLVAPLQAYYAAKAKIRDPRAGVSLGAKHGGGNGQPVRC